MTLKIFLYPMVTAAGLKRLAGQPSRFAYAFSREELESVASGIRKSGVEVEILAAEELPAASYHQGRNQYRISPIVEAVRKKLKTFGGISEKILMLTDADIYEVGMTFTGGLAELGGKVAMVSAARFQSGDRDKFVRRLVKECLHELGHTLGLEHCKNSDCVMFLSRSLADSDLKESTFCAKCQGVLGRALR